MSYLYGINDCISDVVLLAVLHYEGFYQTTCMTKDIFRPSSYDESNIDDFLFWLKVQLNQCPSDDVEKI